MEAVYIDSMGTDKSVVNAARVSFANQGDEGRTPEQDEKLIQYLAKHKHWTPFGHTSITLRMTAPVPIRTQCFKHKVGFVENEESRRYISCEPVVFYPDWRESCDNKKQGSGGRMGPRMSNICTTAYDESVTLAIRTYKDLLSMGACEEQARFVLPQGCEVNWYWTGSLMAFARFAKQRLDPHAQLEIQELAKEVSTLIEPLFPVSWKALMES